MSPFHKPPIEKILRPFEAFARMQAAGGLVLMVATIAALVWANSPWSESYFALWQTKLTVGLGHWQLSKESIHWINDGLMAVFFFLVGLEIKREVLVGGLSTPRQTIMPIAAAVAGMVVPALIFVAFNAGKESLGGWGIPMATDIAFALGILSLLGDRVPISLKIFLTAVAIVDDIGAILVIALFYTSSLDISALALGLFVLLLMFGLNRLGVRHSIPYLALGMVMWLAFLISGIHATIAGVLAAMSIPATTRIDCGRFVSIIKRNVNLYEKAHPPGACMPGLNTKEQLRALAAMEHTYKLGTTPLQNIEHGLHGWVSFGVMPIFALANAGVALEADILTELIHPVSVGIFFGLVLGKQAGITAICWLLNKTGIARYPEGVSLRHIYGAGWLAGVGFTMSIFIANLAFGEGSRLLELAKIGILFASLMAGIGGFLVLQRTAPVEEDG
ncbi:Na+/H+ antiporter NhaA [Salidesulfovibrio onnuriiensis]|uniref:Na+/H+ antiporter NhaA n=1 Tax=Salidesulfovibrio onnuriiensis TaxID=2583823 RepID=UPI0011CC30BB|nr:Na+/H+ antiporter NhaA [Salidesulfovibrio onnuriiensis]